MSRCNCSTISSPGPGRTRTAIISRRPRRSPPAQMLPHDAVGHAVPAGPVHRVRPRLRVLDRDGALRIRARRSASSATRRRRRATPAINADRDGLAHAADLRRRCRASPAFSRRRRQSGQLNLGFPSGYGFTAIIVSFLGRLHPIGVVLAGIVLAISYVGGQVAQTGGACAERDRGHLPGDDAVPDPGQRRAGATPHPHRSGPQPAAAVTTAVGAAK